MSACAGSSSATARALELRDELGVEIDTGDGMAAAGEVEGDPARCRSRDRESGRGSVVGEALPQRQVRRRRSRTRRRARSRPAPHGRASRLTPSSPRRGRGRRASSAARAAPCRWAGRRAALGGGDGAVEGGGDVRLHLDRLRRPARVLEPHGHLRGSRPGADDAPDRGSRSSKSASQTQEMSRPSAIRSLSAIQRSIPSPASSLSVRRTSFAPAGFLISRIETGLPATSIVSTRPNTARISASPAADRVQPDAQLERRGDRRQGVVDVVEAGQRQPQAELARGRRDLDARAGHALELDRGRGDLGLGPRAPQLGQE